jgi:hypothetical protein
MLSINFIASPIRIFCLSLIAVTWTFVTIRLGLFASKRNKIVKSWSRADIFFLIISSCAVIRLPLAAFTSLFIFTRQDIIQRGNEHPEFPTGIFVLQVFTNLFYWLPLIVLIFALYNRLYQLTGHIEDVAVSSA